MVKINDSHFLAGSLKSVVSDFAPAGATGITIPRWVVKDQTSALVSGTPIARAIELPQNLVVANLSVVSEGAETGGTHLWQGLLDNQLILRAVSADNTGATALPGLGAVVTQAVGPFTITAYSGVYYHVLCASFTGTAPTLAACVLATGVAAIAPAFCGTSGPTQSTPPALGTQFSAIAGAGALNYLAWTS